MRVKLYGEGVEYDVTYPARCESPHLCYAEVRARECVEEGCVEWVDEKAPAVSLDAAGRRLVIIGISGDETLVIRLSDFKGLLVQSRDVVEVLSRALSGEDFDLRGERLA